MHREDGLSPTHEMYLKVLYRLQLKNHFGRVRDMAKGLGVTPSTVSAVLKKLENAGLLHHDRYEAVKLTPAGSRIAECVVRRFEIIKSLLIEILGLDEAAAEVDACMMEHAVSPATVNRMETLLEAVRTGGMVLQPTHGVGSPVSVCSECEAAEACQAVAAMETRASAGRPEPKAK